MYTFAFLPEPPEPLTLPQGIQGDLLWVGDGFLGAVVEPDFSWEQAQINDRALMESVLAHDRVMAELFAQSALLPLQFGTRFVDRASIIQHLEQQRDFYGQRLNFLSGKGEFTLKLSPLEGEENPTTPKSDVLKGREYFLAKKQQYEVAHQRQQQQQQQLQDLRATVGRVYPDFHPGEEAEGQQRWFLLVGLRRSQHLQKQVQQWQTTADLWQLTLTGPLPPYHFVQPG